MVDNVGQILAALIASAACAWKATRTANKERRGWILLALSTGALAIGQVIYAYYDLVLATPNSVPALVQLAYIGGAPLAFAGMLCFWDAPRGTATRWSVWLDGLIIVLSLIFIEWALDLRTTVMAAIQSTDQQIAAYLPTYYLFADILIGTILILAIRRATHHQQGRMLLLLGGLAAISLSDSTFAYLTANNQYTAGDVIDSGWVVGYLMIALAALWPVSETSTRIRTAPVDLWQLALPLTTVVVAAITCSRPRVFGTFPGRRDDGHRRHHVDPAHRPRDHRQPRCGGDADEEPRVGRQPGGGHRAGAHRLCANRHGVRDHRRQPAVQRAPRGG